VFCRPASSFTTSGFSGSRFAAGGSFLALFAPESVHQLQEFLKARKPFRDEILRVTIGSREAWWSMSGQPMADGGWRGVCSDITRSRDAEARIAYVTEYDTLTDLPNRAMLVRQLEMAEEAAKERDESFALFVIDLPDLGGAARLREAGIEVRALMEFEGD
jgi:predicted signal transduction protein with EAL and GGDEF domain